MKREPTVSIIIPCLNEEKFIGRCLDSILTNNYPQERLEILVVDGRSDDATRSIVQDYARTYPFIRLLDNPKKITPAAMNIGVASSSGDLIMRMDAHSEFPSNYISGLVTWLESTDADNVGGLCLTRAACKTPKAQAIAIGLSHPFGVGNSRFRIGASEPLWVDTVPFGCYRRDVFDRIGQFDEELVRNQDDEFNLRLIRRGGRILLVPEIVSYYYARESLLKVWRMFYQYGYFKPLVARKVGGIMTLRQAIPPAFILSLVGTGILAPWLPGMAVAGITIMFAYAASAIACSVALALKRNCRCTVPLCAVFPVLHFSYGLGFLKGVVDFVVLRRRSVAEPDRVAISR